MYKYLYGLILFMVVVIGVTVLLTVVIRPTPEAIVKNYLLQQLGLDDSNESQLKVSECSWMDNDALRGYVCAVTITAEGTSNTVILPFKQSELDGKTKPLEEKPLKFDHRKDVDI